MSIQGNNLRIALCASGSRGDIQPYIALGLELKKRGHIVTIVSEKRMEGLVKEFNLLYSKIEGDPTGLLFENYAQKALQDGSIFQLIKLTKEWDKKFNKMDILNSYISACSGSDIIISSGLTMTQSFCAAEYHGCKWLPMILGPTLATSEFPLWALSGITMGMSCLNKWTYNVAFQEMWKNEKDLINTWRKDNLNLPIIKAKYGIAEIIDELKPPIIVACSAVICGPKKRIPGDYPVNAHLLGFVFVQSSNEDEIDPLLVKFINNDRLITRNGGTRPLIYLGFGSMPTPNPEKFLQLAIDVCKFASCRAILVAGWSELNGEACKSLLAQDDIDNTLFVTKSVAHDWLFPKCEAIVHHCGVGTMAAALRSGQPQIPCPVMLDQPFNAKTLVKLGCAPNFIDYKNLTANNLSKELINLFSVKGDKCRSEAKILERIINLESKESIIRYCEIVENECQIKSNSVSSNPLVLRSNSNTSNSNKFDTTTPKQSFDSVPKASSNNITPINETWVENITPMNDEKISGIISTPKSSGDENTWTQNNSSIKQNKQKEEEITHNDVVSNLLNDIEDTWKDNVDI